MWTDAATAPNISAFTFLHFVEGGCNGKYMLPPWMALYPYATGRDSSVSCGSSICLYREQTRQKIWVATNWSDLLRFCADSIIYDIVSTTAHLGYSLATLWDSERGIEQEMLV
jgi:hypothetical protein